MAFLKSGDHLVCSRDVFGTTTVLLDKYLSKMGVETTFVPVTDLALWRQSIRPETKLLFLETPSNPLCEVADITALAELARAEDVLFVVDNCLCPPALQKPLALVAE